MNKTNNIEPINKIIKIIILLELSAKILNDFKITGMKNVCAR